VSDRVVLLADGEITGEGPTRDVVCHSPVFSPQVAKILSPIAVLTVTEVREALEAAGA
jgi:energy-coupling factor transport system ATP-binding protein